MAVQLITYDLHRPGQNYSALHEAIKGLGSWWHCVESTWLVNTTLGAAQVRDRIAPHLDANDELLVVAAGGDWAARGMQQACYDWLRQNL